MDVICLQETHFNNNDNINEIFKDFKGQYFINSINKGRKLGVGILFKQGLNVNVIKTIKDTEGRTLSLLCQFNDDFLVNIVCIYAPNKTVERSETIRKGQGLWVMNNSVLNDNAYKKLVIKFWEGWKLKKEGFNNLLIWWDIGKKRIKSLTIDYCKEKRRTERMYIQLKHIEKHLLHLSEQKQLDDMTELHVQDKIKD